MEYALRIFIGAIVGALVLLTSAWGPAGVTFFTAWLGAWLLTFLRMRTSLEDVALALAFFFLGVGMLRDDWIHACMGAVFVVLWYGVLHLFASRGSRAVMSVSSGALFLFLWAFGFGGQWIVALLVAILHVFVSYLLFPHVSWRAR